MSDFFDVIAETSSFLVIYKKPNTSFHSDDGGAGLFETVKQALHLETLYPVHRLDKVTSGVLVMAKTLSANQELIAQFTERTIDKYYLAISAKKPKKKQGLIKGDMEAARRGAWKLLNSQKNPAITQFFSCAMGDGMRLFIIKPRTGKTHQIRVALKSIGSPILGDSLYANTDSCEGIDRVYLHAFSLAFRLEGSSYRFTELPREGRNFFTDGYKVAATQFLAPWQLPWPN